jgi:protein-tyrosine-phosphatase
MRQDKEDMHENPVIIFVCEHGAAKSIIATAYFNKLASSINLSIRAIARGTNPDPEFSTKTMEGLHRDGLILPEGAPQKLTLADVESSQQIVSFCELPIEYQRIRRGGSRSVPTIEIWDDVPPVSENYEKARDKIVAKVMTIMK